MIQITLSKLLKITLKRLLRIVKPVYHLLKALIPLKMKHFQRRALIIKMHSLKKKKPIMCTHLLLKLLSAILRLTILYEK